MSIEIAKLIEVIEWKPGQKEVKVVFLDEIEKEMGPMPKEGVRDDFNARF